MKWHREVSQVRAVMVAVCHCTIAGVWISGVPPTAIAQAVPPTATSAQSQVPPLKVPRFEVVSVKLSKPGEEGGMQLLPDGLRITNMGLQSLLQVTQQVGAGHIKGLPNWANTAKFDIDAKLEPADLSAWSGLNPSQKFLALLPLLADRFQLRAHTETKPGSGYALVIAKNGPQLKEAAQGEATRNQIGKSHIAMQAATLASAAQLLSTWMGRTVVDRTGLAGKYDLTLDWTPEIDDGKYRSAPQTSGAGPQPEPENSQGPSIFTAIQEQLGLKLAPESVPVDVLVVDHVEMPSAN